MYEKNNSYHPAALLAALALLPAREAFCNMDPVAQQICPCFHTSGEPTSVVLELILDETGRVASFSSLPLLDPETADCVKASLSDEVFDGLGYEYSRKIELELPRTCIYAETGWEKLPMPPDEERPPRELVKGRGLLTAGILLAALGPPVIAIPLIIAATNIFGCGMFEDNDDNCSSLGPFYAVAGAGALTMLAGVPLIIAGSIIIRRYVISHRSVPAVSIAPDIARKGVTASLVWRF
jgi:hypothetical protein